MFEIIPYIRKKKIYINNIAINHVNCRAKLGDFIRLDRYYIDRVALYFILRSFRFTFVFNSPRFMYVNYQLLFVILEKQPLGVDFAFPIKLDMYRATGYY